MATRTRHQAGQIIERSGTFYVRHYITGSEGRQRVVARLCVKDAKHRSTSCAAIKQLRDKYMLKVNADAGAAPKQNPHDVTVAEFWDETYLPWTKENLRPSSVFGYEKIWKQHLKPHFQQRTLRSYRTHEGSLFVTGLVKTLGRNSLQHVRSLASGIFTHALNLGLIESNPWHDVKVLAKIRAPEPTKHYTLDEAEKIITALLERVDAQSVFGLAFFMGLRPSEIAGLKWEDVDGEHLHIRRAVVRGFVGETKTPESVATLPLIQPVRGLLELWREKSGGARTGWIFPNQKNGPLNVVSFVRNAMMPTVRNAGLEWKGLYSGRRGCATILTKLNGGNQLVAASVLRHRFNSRVTGDNYIKLSNEAGREGLKLLEQAAAGSLPATQEPE